MFPQMFVICSASGITLSSYISRRMERQSSRVHSTNCSRWDDWLQTERNYNWHESVKVAQPLVYASSDQAATVRKWHSHGLFPGCYCCKKVMSLLPIGRSRCIAVWPVVTTQFSSRGWLPSPASHFQIDLPRSGRHNTVIRWAFHLPQPEKICWFDKSTCALCTLESVESHTSKADTGACSWVEHMAGWSMWLGGACGWVEHVAGWSMWLGGACGWVEHVAGWSMWLGGACGWVEHVAGWSMWLGVAVFKHFVFS